MTHVLIPKGENPHAVGEGKNFSGFSWRIQEDHR
jgi:hypothetical protein